MVIGGASFLGGRGNVGNALIGALMIGVIRNGMNLHNVDAFVQLIVLGVVIVGAVELDVDPQPPRGTAASAPGVTGVTRGSDRRRESYRPGPPTLSVRGATKRFGAVLALDAVDLHVTAGEVLAVLGDNGAGKSTLIKCLSGAHRLDEGVIEIDGRACPDPLARGRPTQGIETVYQDLALFDNLDPAANFYAGRELAGPTWLPRGLRFLRTRQMADDTRATPRATPGAAARTEAHRRPHVRWPATGGRGRPGGRLQLAGRDPRRAHGRPGHARVEAGP